MADRATVRQIVNIGVEATAGTAVPTTKQLQGVHVDVTPKVDSKDYLAMGQKYATLVEINKEWVEGKLSGEVLYNEIQYLLSSIFGAAATITQNGAVSNRGYSWTWNPSTSLEDVPKTLTLEQGDAVRAHKFPFGHLPDLSVQWDRKAVALGGTIQGQRLSDGITLTPVVSDVWTLTITGTPTGGTFTLTAAVNGSTQTTATIPFNGTAAQVQTALAALTNIGAGNVSVTGTQLPAGSIVITFNGQISGQAVTLTHTDSLTGGSSPVAVLVHTTPGTGPAELAIAPVLPSQIDVYMDTSAAALGTTQLSRCFMGKWGLTGKYKPLWRLNSSDTSFVAQIETAPKSTVSLRVEADAQGMGLLTNMRAGSTNFIRIKATGPQIDATPFNYLLQIDVAMQVSAPKEFKDEDGVYAIEFDGTIVTDDTWGQSMKILLQNQYNAL